MVKVYCFDLDNTLCETNNLDYGQSIPIYKNIKKVNQLYADGNYIKIFTARGSETGIDWKEPTLFQLKLWGINFHELILGKPAADYYIDDKAINVQDFEW